MPKKKIKDIEWLLNTYKEFYQTFGMEEENIRSYYDEWKQRNGERIEDFLWHIFNTLLHENASQSEDLEGFYTRNWQIYSEMVRFRRQYEGKRANEIWKQMNQNSLARNYEHSSLECYALIIPVSDCEFFDKSQKYKYPIKQILKDDIIPYDKCERKQGCACLYGLEPIRDSEGSLIIKK